MNLQKQLLLPAVAEHGDIIIQSLVLLQTEKERDYNLSPMISYLQAILQRYAGKLAKRLMPLFTDEYKRVDLEKEYEELKKLSIQERLERINNEMK